MWTRTEIAYICTFLNTWNLEDFLTTQEIEAIPESMVPNLSSRMIEPKHTKPVITELIVQSHIFL